MQHCISAVAIGSGVDGRWLGAAG